MICKICGTKNNETAAFCENCGNPLHRPDPVPQPQPVIAEPVAAPVPAGELPAKGLGIAGLVLGIVSIVFCCCIGFLSAAFAITGLIFSIIAMKRAKAVGMKNNTALAGLILSIIDLVLSLLYTLLLVAAMMMEYA